MSGLEQRWEVIYRLADGQEIHRKTEPRGIVNQIEHAWRRHRPWVINSWLYDIVRVTEHGPGQANVTVELISGCH